ncbi:peptidylprolyl isomerase [candidate division KSB1 bacterium]|nr:peptidylprolyl isomerase [candidate division KSB1 bacterium]
MRHRYLTAVAAIAVSLLGIVCSRNDALVVQVGDQKLTADAVLELFRRAPDYRGSEPTTVENLRTFIDREIVPDLLFQHQGYCMGLDRDSLVLEKLQATLKELLTRQNGVLYNRIIEPCEISETEINELYRREGVQRRIAHILVRRRETADSLLQRLRNGADFGELARRHSTDRQTAQSGGVLPRMIVSGRVEAALDSVLFSLAVGEYSEPVWTSAGYHVFQMLEESERKCPPLAQERERIRRLLEMRKQQALLESFLRDLFDRYAVTYTDSLLERVLEIYEERLGERLLHPDRLGPAEGDQTIAVYAGERMTLDQFIHFYTAPPPGMRTPLRNTEDVRDFVRNRIAIELLYLKAIEMELDRDTQVVAQMDLYRDNLVRRLAKNRLVNEQVEVDSLEVEAVFRTDADRYRDMSAAEARRKIHKRLQQKQAEELSENLSTQWRKETDVRIDDGALEQMAKHVTAEKNLSRTPAKRE